MTLPYRRDGAQLCCENRLKPCFCEESQKSSLDFAGEEASLVTFICREGEAPEFHVPEIVVSTQHCELDIAQLQKEELEHPDKV